MYYEAMKIYINFHCLIIIFLCYEVTKFLYKLLTLF